MATQQTISGGCRCGQARYTVRLDGPPRVYACHCSQCKTSTGSAFALQLPVATEALEVTGHLTTADYPNSRGGVSTHHFCAACLTRLYGLNTARPGLAIVRGGTLDDSATLTPVGHVFVESKQPWISLPDGVPAFAAGPSPAEWMTIIAPGRG